MDSIDDEYKPVLLEKSNPSSCLRRNAITIIACVIISLVVVAYLLTYLAKAAGDEGAGNVIDSVHTFFAEDAENALFVGVPLVAALLLSVGADKMRAPGSTSQRREIAQDISMLGLSLEYPIQEDGKGGAFARLTKQQFDSLKNQGFLLTDRGQEGLLPCGDGGEYFMNCAASTKVELPTEGRDTLILHPYYHLPAGAKKSSPILVRSSNQVDSFQGTIYRSVNGNLYVHYQRTLVI